MQILENKLINCFLKIDHLSDDEIKHLKSSMLIKKYPKGSLLAKEGQINVDTYFILDGCIKQYKVVNGNNISTNFYIEEEWIIAFGQSEHQTPCEYYLECIEDSTVIIGNEEKAKKIFLQFPHLEKISGKIIEGVFEKYQSHMTSYITDTPEQRYIKLLKTRPDIFQRIPQYDIATYIGVKPESLSRIKKKILHNSSSKAK